LGKRKQEQQEAWVATTDLPKSPGHPFYRKLNCLLAEAGFDTWLESLCQPYYADGRGRDSIPPGVYFRMVLVGYFEGIASQRGIAWRCSDSRSLAEFLGVPVDKETPDHSSLSRIHGRLPLEVHEAMFVFVLQIAAQKQLQIVSPAVNYCSGNCNQTDPFQWLDDFFAACPNCKVDYIGAHWYACTINALEDYITQMEKYNKPIWLTEFACADGGPYTPDQVKTYALQAENWLEHEPSIFRYSWFSGRTDAIPNVNLLAGSGVLTDLGTAYVNQAPKRCP